MNWYSVYANRMFCAASRSMAARLMSRSCGAPVSICLLYTSPTNIFKSFTPPQKGQGRMLEGADKNTCAELAAELLKKHII